MSRVKSNILALFRVFDEMADVRALVEILVITSGSFQASPRFADVNSF